MPKPLTFRFGHPDDAQHLAAICMDGMQQQGMLGNDNTSVSALRHYTHVLNTNPSSVLIASLEQKPVAFIVTKTPADAPDKVIIDEMYSAAPPAYKAGQNLIRHLAQTTPPHVTLIIEHPTSFGLPFYTKMGFAWEEVALELSQPRLKKWQTTPGRNRRPDFQT